MNSSILDSHCGSAERLPQSSEIRPLPRPQTVPVAAEHSRRAPHQTNTPLQSRGAGQFQNLRNK